MAHFRFLAAGLVMVGACGLAYALRPTPAVDVRSVDLERQIPSSFGQWREVRTNLVQMNLAPQGENGTAAADVSWPYDQTLARAYARPDGEVVMLALAWGSKQRQEIKVHRPELCYLGQGFQVLQTTRSRLRLGEDSVVATTRLVTRGQTRMEVVTYWIRIGEEISSSAWKSRLEILEEGLKGKIPDGILVRVSQAFPLNRTDLAGSYAVHEAFVRDLVAHVEPSTVKLLTGIPGGK